MITEPVPSSSDARVHAELRRSERRFRTLANATATVLWITTPDGRAVPDNPSWQAFTGQTPKQYEGWGWVNAVHPDDRDLLLERWREGMAAGVFREVEYRLYRVDGQYRRVIAHAAPVLDDDGQVLEWIGNCTDVTEARDTEAALRASEERFRFLDQLGQASREGVDAASLMALTSRMLGEHLAVSRCAYADVEPDNNRFTIRHDWSAPGVGTSAGLYSLDLFGEMACQHMRGGITLVIHDVDRELGRGHGADMFNAIGVKAIICSPLVKDGQLIAMMAVHSRHPRRWSDHEVVLVEEVVERCWAHIERVRDAVALREQDRRKDEFLATLAHELRNPLAPIRYALNLIRLSPPGGATAVRAQHVIDRQVTTMVRLIDDLLDLSRVSRGLIQLQKAPVKLSQVVDLALEASRPGIQAAGHHLEVLLPKEEIELLADETRLAQVLSNLLNNAAKYTPDGGRIILSAWREEGEKLVMEVSDNGIGIPLEEQGRLFEMFSRLPHSASRSQGGLGIGLSLARHLVEMHGGTVSAFSAGRDEGSIFRIRLPVITSAPEPMPEPASPPSRVGSRGSASTSAAESASTSATRVLVVEDNPDGLETLLELLGLMNYEVEGAPSGEVALNLIDEFAPQIVLLDIGLPGISGHEVARRIRANSQHADCTIVALTGWSSVEDRRKTAEAGFDYHLAKPVSPADLESLLNSLAA